MNKTLNKKLLIITLKGLGMILLASPIVAFIVFAYSKNLLFFRTALLVCVDVLVLLARSPFVWFAAGVYIVFLILAFLIGFAMDKLKATSKKDER